MQISQYLKEEISIGPKLFLSKIIVIGPYPTRDFFDRILDFSPEKLVLFVDDGWPVDNLENIKNLCMERRRKITIHRIAATNGIGLVHAKLYYFEWKNFDRNYTRRILLSGSANASLQGFGVHAESFINIDFADIPQKHRIDVLRYLDALEQKKEVDVTKLTVGNNKSWISLPALRVVNKNLPNGFDAWLRRGKLSHHYQVDPAFGQLMLRLKKAMPKTALEENLGDSRFRLSGDPQIFSRPYVSYQVGIEDSKKQTWRKRFFIETDYGYWTSSECFSQLRDKFVASNSERREQVIDTIRKADENSHKIWLEEFAQALKQVANRVADPSQISEFFEVNDGSLNIDKYLKTALKKLQGDRQKAEDKYFQERFISGFAFPPMPQFGDEFAIFAISFCNNLLSKITGRRVENKLALVLSEELEDNLPESGEELYYYLCNNWGILRQQMLEFHEE